MSDARKRKLVELGPEALANALLDLAENSDSAYDLIERLIATPEGNINLFRQKLADLEDSDFISWRESSDFAYKLSAMLQGLKFSVDDPVTGVKLIAEFYEADELILGNCDDSSGSIGEIFRLEASELFWEYANRCSDKALIADMLLTLHMNDDYGVRSFLLDNAGDSLPESVIRSMISVLQSRADEETDDYRKRCHLGLIESLARQIKDATLFEKTRIASWGNLSSRASVDIARVYFDSGDVEKAYSLLMKIPENEMFNSCDCEQLLIQIYREQGDTDKLIEVLYRKFRSYRCTEYLQELLAVLGNDRMDEVVTEEISIILRNPTLVEHDVEFLISVGRIDDAEEYLLARADQLDGDCYGALISLAENMEWENRHLAASLLYRSLLLSILKRGYTKAYHHGTSYLKKLDQLDSKITFWKDFDSHEVFKSQISKDHGRKYSFWSKYNG